MKVNLRYLYIIGTLVLYLSGCSFFGGSAPVTYSVHGEVTDETGSGLNDVTLLFGGDFGIAETDEGGKWFKSNLKAVTTVIPVKNGWKFEPATRTISSTSSNINFIGTEQLVAEPTFRAFYHNQKLLLILSGGGSDARNTFYIETGTDGYNHPYWKDSKISYVVDANILYGYIGTSKGSWVKVGEVNPIIAGELEVISIDLSQFEFGSDHRLMVGWTNNKGYFVPSGTVGLLAVENYSEGPVTGNTFYPVEFHGVMNNPYKGWSPDSKGGPYRQPHRLVRTEMLWSEIEPERGNFDWETFEAENKFPYWDSRGVSYIIRFRMDVPSTRGQAQMEIPSWLYDMIDGDGTWYDTSEIGSGFSPNYSNPILIEEHERFLQAFGDRYNNDSRVAFIQLGSVGHWGEWHTWPSGSGVFPEEEVANQYIQHYVDFLDQKMLGIRRPLAHARKNNFGYFNDRIGHTPTTEQWLFWINNGMDYDNWYNGMTYPDAAVPDFWKKAYSAGEFGSGNALLWLKDDTIEETLRQIRLSHTSWIGPCSAANLRNIPELANADEVLKTMGYRFVVENVTHVPKISSGQVLDVQMVLNNKGVAPFYFPWYLEVGLANGEGTLVQQTIANVDIREWLPGSHTFRISLDVPFDVPSGSYTLVTSINDPSTAAPGVDLAIEGRRPDGRYNLSKIEISSNP